MEIRLGRVAGDPVVIAGNYLVYAGLMVLFDLIFNGLTTALNTTALMFAVAVCVLLHEFGHVLAGKRFGVRTNRVTLNFFGGIAAANPVDAYRLMDQPKRALVVWAAGPAVNIVLFGLLTLVSPLTTGIPLLYSAVWWLKVVNLYMACFNLLPLFPTDGGGILYSILRFFTTRRRAITVACAVSMAGSIALGLFMLKLHAIIGVFIAGMIFVSAYRIYKDPSLF